MAMDVIERAQRYVAKMEPAISGSDGNRQLMNVCMSLVHGFALSEGDAVSVLSGEWNNACQPPWSEAELVRAVRNAINKSSDKPRGYMLQSSGNYARPQGGRRNEGVAYEPRRQNVAVPDFDPALLKRVIQHVPHVSREWFKARSPMPVQGVTPGQFLEALYDEGQRVLVFTTFKSQGQFLWESGKGGYRLASQPGVKATPSKLPVDGGKDGVWFLANPVSGKWEKSGASNKMTRRSKVNVTQWRYVVLESDDAPEADWLRLLAMLELPIAALYSSGGRSIHALIRVDEATYEEMDATIRGSFKRNLCPLGADGGALSAVRLTRLPGCLRGGKEQELIYLDPQPTKGKLARILDRNPN